MYKIITLFALLFTGCANAVYDTISPAKYSGITPQKGDSSIVIMSELGSVALYKKITQGLSQQGYHIQSRDQNTLVISSDWKSFSPDVQLKINASVYEFRDGSIARLNGLWMNTDQHQNISDVQNGAVTIEYSEKSLPWNGLHNFATSIFSLEQITYE